MAEGWARHLKSDFIEAFSAGIEKHSVDSLAVQVMAESGVDISSHRSKLIDELEEKDFDYVITLCHEARESCPVFHGHGVSLHVGFEDPPELAGNAKSNEEKLSHYRRIRDEIGKFVEGLPETLPASEGK